LGNIRVRRPQPQERGGELARSDHTDADSHADKAITHLCSTKEQIQTLDHVPSITPPPTADRQAISMGGLRGSYAARWRAEPIVMAWASVSGREPLTKQCGRSPSRGEPAWGWVAARAW